MKKNGIKEIYLIMDSLKDKKSKIFICENLHYSIGYKRIFRNLSFEISPGELWILTGDNGVGKSTLLKLIYENKSKEFLWNTKSKVPVSYLGHEIGLYSSLSLMENLEFFGGILGENLKKDEINELLNKFNLQKRILDPVHTFSEGMKKKSGIIRSLIPNSDLLLLDEPFNGLDKKSNEVFKDIIKNYIKDKSIIIATHDPYLLKDFTIGELNIINLAMEVKRFVV